MKPQSKLLWLSAFLLGWLFDLLFWKKSPGINFPIFMSLALIGGAFYLLAGGLRPARKSLWLLAPFAFFALMTCLRREPLTAFLAHAFTLLSLALLAATWLGGRWMQYGLFDYTAHFFTLSMNVLFLPLTFLERTRKELAESGQPKGKSSVWPVLRGLLLALPILLVFASLLASADLVFSDKLNSFFEQFDLQRILEYTTRLILIPFYAYLLAGVFLHAGEHSRDEKLIGEEKPVMAPFLGFTETGVVLGSVALLFLSFVIIQFRYFFGGEANIGVTGYTYSEYARRGFNELLAVAIISLLMVLGFGAITKRETATHKRIYSGLSVIIVAQVIVILVSSFQRITLANYWHGYSRLRLYPQVFLVWLGALFVTVVLLEIIRRERFFALAALLASLGFAASLSLLNVDALIVRHNVLRAVLGRHFNVTHLAMLSSDAVPALVDEFQDQTLPPLIHEGIGAALLCHSYSLEDSLPADWRSSNLSLSRADGLLEQVLPQLVEYRRIGKGGASRVRTRGGEEYLCSE